MKKNITVVVLSVLLLLSLILNGVIIFRMISYNKNQTPQLTEKDFIKKGYLFNTENLKGISRNEKTFYPIDVLSKIWIFEKDVNQVFKFWRYKEEEKKEDEKSIQPGEIEFSGSETMTTLYSQGRQIQIPSQYVLIENSQQFIEEKVLREIFYKMYLVPEDNNKTIVVDPANFQSKELK
jgi:hypothetical protein